MERLKPYRSGLSCLALVGMAALAPPMAPASAAVQPGRAPRSPSLSRSECVERAAQGTTSDPQGDAFRSLKNKRYNTGGRDLTAPDPQGEERDRFVEHHWFRDFSLFPCSDSAVVVLGTLRVQL